MPNTITFQAILQGDTCYVPNDDGVLSWEVNADGSLKLDADKKPIPALTIDDIDASEITEYTFVNQNRNTGLGIRVSDRIATFDLTKDDEGRYDGAAYSLAQAVAFAEVYASAVSWRQMDQEPAQAIPMPAVTREALCELPEGILRAYYIKSNKGVSLAALKKRPKDGTPLPASPETQEQTS